MNSGNSNILKAALFATGVAGIVAEYILSTLATYFLGDSVFQWTMIVSIMLFSMGLGSRLSRYVDQHLLEKFIYIEFTLSLLASFCAIIVYYLTAFTAYTGVFIYALAIVIGILIGMEIPLVTRLNDQFEELKINIATVLEKDYYGSLAGGIFFAFVGLPFLGLTYTPFILGAVNFLVAAVLLWKLRGLIRPKRRKLLAFLSIGLALVLIMGTIFSGPIILYGDQSRYRDKIIYQEQTRYQKLVITQWRDHFWLFINGNQQLSTYDEWLYHEPLVHPAMLLVANARDVLILGGGDGCAAREVLKYPSVEKVTVVDLDPAMTALGKKHPLFVELNEDALNQTATIIENADAFSWLDSTIQFFDVIVADLPDPKTVDLSRLYSREFYTLCRQHLRSHGVLVTQAGSPYYAPQAFRCIDLTMQEAGFSTLPMHNQVLTLGEWGWILGMPRDAAGDLKMRLLDRSEIQVPTRWLNAEALLLITSFGKPLQSIPDNEIEINSLIHPVLMKYYNRGEWELY